MSYLVVTRTGRQHEFPGEHAIHEHQDGSLQIHRWDGRTRGEVLASFAVGAWESWIDTAALQLGDDTP